MAEYQGQTKTINKLSEPPSYRVILLNDDYTTQEFVIEVLIEIYQKNENEAINLMLMVHKEGSATVGVYCYDVAATKVQMTIELARRKSYPLQAIYERV
ncbi:MAG: ATP-dependent Clp protease adaptor ClpS [Spirochaetaceae bacterium]|nr:ATP-dependent Clp protease adaptor ClpS [Spirochaetaceae bacterium]